MQRADLLTGENKKDEKLDSQVLGIGTGEQYVNGEPQGSFPKEGYGEQVFSGRLDFFAGVAWCQALIFRSWIEASDKLMKLQSGKVSGREIPTLYVDVHEEVFTTLFKSQSYASNLGRAINASMVMLKNWKNLTPGCTSESRAGIKAR